MTATADSLPVTYRSALGEKRKPLNEVPVHSPASATGRIDEITEMDGRVALAISDAEGNTATATSSPASYYGRVGDQITARGAVRQGSDSKVIAAIDNGIKPAAGGPDA